MTKPTFSPQHEPAFTLEDGTIVYRGQLPEHPDYYLQHSDTTWWICDSSGEIESRISEPTLDPAYFIAGQLINGNISRAIEMAEGMSPSLLDALHELGVTDNAMSAMNRSMCLSKIN